MSASDVVAVNVSPDLRTEMEVSAGRGVPDARGSSSRIVHVVEPAAQY